MKISVCKVLRISGVVTGEWGVLGVKQVTAMFYDVAGNDSPSLCSSPEHVYRREGKSAPARPYRIDMTESQPGTTHSPVNATGLF